MRLLAFVCAVFCFSCFSGFSEDSPPEIEKNNLLHPEARVVLHQGYFSSLVAVVHRALFFSIASDEEPSGCVGKDLYVLDLSENATIREAVKLASIPCVVRFHAEENRLLVHHRDEKGGEKLNIFLQPGEVRSPSKVEDSSLEGLKGKRTLGELRARTRYIAGKGSQVRTLFAISPQEILGASEFRKNDRSQIILDYLSTKKGSISGSSPQRILDGTELSLSDFLITRAGELYLAADNGNTAKDPFGYSWGNLFQLERDSGNHFSLKRLSTLKSPRFLVASDFGLLGYEQSSLSWRKPFVFYIPSGSREKMLRLAQLAAYGNQIRGLAFVRGGILVSDGDKIMWFGPRGRFPERFEEELLRKD